MRFSESDGIVFLFYDFTFEKKCNFSLVEFVQTVPDICDIIRSSTKFPTLFFGSFGMKSISVKNSVFIFSIF